MGDNRPDSTLKDTAFKQDMVLAFEAFNTYISAQPDHLPLIAAAGVFLLEADDITERYSHNHFLRCKASQMVVDLVA